MKHIKNFDTYNKVNEGLIDWTEENTRSLVRQMNQGRNKRYILNVKEPLQLITRDVELYHKLKLYLVTNRIPFENREVEE